MGPSAFLRSVGASHGHVTCICSSYSPTDPTCSSCIVMTFTSVLWHLNPGASVFQLQVSVRVPVVKIVALELVLWECKEVQGKRGWEEGATEAGYLQHLSSGLLSYCLFKFFKFKCNLRLICPLSSFVLLCVYWKTMEILSCEWGGRPEFGISARPVTKEVFTRYLSDWIIKLYSLSQRSLYKYIFTKN